MKIHIIASGSTIEQRKSRYWGVSFLLEDVLFDTFGQPQVLLENMRKMKLDARKINHIVISHEHWDHISGLWQLLDINNRATVYVCEQFSDEFKNRIKEKNVKVADVSGSLKIKENIFSTGPIKGIYDKGVIYEQSLVCKTEKGLTLITGCAHPGILNIVNSVRENFNSPVYALIGGLHLKDAKKQQVEEVIGKLKSSGLGQVAPTHCTGNAAENLFKKAFQQNCIGVAECSSLDY